MLISSIILLYVFAISFTTGFTFLLLLQSILKTEIFRFHSSLVILFGLCCTGVVLQSFHLIHAIDTASHLLVWLISITGMIVYRKQLPQFIGSLFQDFFGSRIKTIFTTGLCLAAILNIIGRAGTGDIGDYHLQAIQWDEHFKAVPGLGNLRRQLGNNSNWFLLHAFTGCWFTGYKSVYVLNAFLLLIAASYFLPQRNEKYFVLKSIMLLYICSMSFRKYVGAVTNDYAITIFTLILFFEWIQTSALQDWKKMIPLLIMFTVLPTFKLSAVLMLCMPAGFLIGLIRSKGPWLKPFAFLLITGLLIFVPWILTNRIQSGYVCYPVSNPDIFKPDWKMNRETLQYELLINKANERVPGIDPATVISMPFSEWFILWLKHLDIFSLFLLLFFSLLLTGYCIFFIFDKEAKLSISERMRAENSLVIFSTIMLALPVWFMNAPATRFVFGYLVFAIAWGVHYLLDSSVSKLSPARFSYICYLSLLIIVVNAVIFIHRYLPEDKLALSVYKPLPYGMNTLNVVEKGNMRLYMPEKYDQCWDGPIPCTSILDSNLTLRGNTIADGFKLKQSP